MIFKFFLFKEIRKFPFFFLLVLLTLTLGSLGILAISIVSDQVQSKLRDRAKELLTSDLSISARRNFSNKEIEIFDQILNLKISRKYRLFDVYSMIEHSKTGQTRLVEIRGIESGFPFYGKIELESKSWVTDSVFVSKELKSLWNIEPGDELKIGKVKVKVEDSVIQDSTIGIRGVSLAPRLYVPLRILEESGLLGFGSIGSYQIHYDLISKDPHSIKELRSQIFKKIQDPAVKVTLPENSSQQTGRALNLISQFMSLASLVGFVLSLIGVFYLYQSHFFVRLKECVLLRIHGVHRQQLFLGLMIQIFSLFVVSFLIQVLLINLSFPFLKTLFENFLGLNFESTVVFKPLLIHSPFLLLLLSTALFPLISGLLRTETGIILKDQKLSSPRMRKRELIPFLGVFYFYCWFLSNSLKIGSFFSIAIFLIFIFSFIVIRGLQYFVKKNVGHRKLALPWIVSGISIKNLARSGHKLSLSFVALTLGASLVTFILQLDSLIRDELKLNQNRPGLFLFDIQEDQLEEFKKFSQDKQVMLEAITPMIRGRLLRLNGVEFKRPKAQVNLRESDEDDDESRSRNSAINMTFRNYLTPSEKIVEGESFTPNQIHSGIAPISLEKRWSQRMGIRLGDKLTFDVQGVEVDGEVVNLREVKWTDFYPNFFVTMAPGYIDEAPKTYLAVTKFGLKNLKNEFQRTSIEKFPNISFIDVEEAIMKLTVIFEKSQLAIKLISFLSVLIGLIIFYAISHDQIYRRVFDLALLKTLGMGATQIRIQLLLEFGFFFFFSTTLGILFGWVFSQVIGKEIFKLSLSLNVLSLTQSFIFLMMLCLVTIFLSSIHVLKTKPKELLTEG